MTYEELMDKLFEDDPIADPDHPERTTRDENGITVLGCYEVTERYTDEACDLHIAIDGDKLILRWRDNENQPDKMWGREWSAPHTFTSYDDMHGFIYTQL